MGSFSISAILGSVNQERPATAGRKQLASRYHAFLDDETLSPVEDDSVELSSEAQAQAAQK